MTAHRIVGNWAVRNLKIIIPTVITAIVVPLSIRVFRAEVRDVAKTEAVECVASLAPSEDDIHRIAREECAWRPDSSGVRRQLEYLTKGQDQMIQKLDRLLERK